MTKKLKELFQLPENLDETDETAIQLKEDTSEVSEDAFKTLEKIDRALPLVKGLESADRELDELAKMAIDSYKELMELGMNVEPKHGPEIFNSASNMLGHAIASKTVKINKKLKMIDQQLKKLQIEAKLLEKTQTIENMPIGEGKALDRNELLKMLNNKNNPDQS
jgi:hypothetical protein